MGLAHYTKTGPSRVSCIDVFISWSSGAERPGHCGVGSGLQWRLHLLCSISSRLNGIFIWCSISLFYLIFFWQFLRFVWLPLYVQWYWSDDERITATIWSMIWFLVYKSLMTYLLPLLVFFSCRGCLFFYVCESESALDVMKKRLVRVSDSQWLITIYIILLIQAAPSVDFVLMSLLVYLRMFAIHCDDELWINFACQTSEMLSASMRRCFIRLSNADIRFMSRKQDVNKVFLVWDIWTWTVIVCAEWIISVVTLILNW